MQTAETRFVFNNHAYQQALKIIKCFGDKEQNVFSGTICVNSLAVLLCAFLLICF